MKKIHYILAFIFFGLFGVVNEGWSTTYISYNDGVQDASTTISSSNVSSGSAGRISWTGTSCTYSSSRVNIAANGSITFTANIGYAITKIVITSGSSAAYYGTWSSSPSVTPSSSSGITTFDELNSTTVRVTTSTAFRCTSASSIKIYYTSAQTTYTVTYDANGGTGTMTDDNEYSSGKTVTVLSNTFTRDGYTFDHWDTKADDSGDDYDAGNTFSISSNTTLYAQWSNIQITKTYYETNLNNINENDTVIFVRTSGTSYAISNDNGTSNAPSPISVTISGTICQTNATNIQWLIIKVGEDTFSFRKIDDNNKHLYCTNTNNGVRVGTNNDSIFKIKNNYLYHFGTSRYIGIYNNQDWRCYTSINSNIENQTFKFYKITGETIYVNNVILSKDTLSLYVGDSYTLTSTIEPENAMNKNIEWFAENESIATIDDGNVTAISEGTTKVWVKTEDGDKTDTCLVIVSSIPPTPTIDVAVWDTNAVYLNIENFNAISASIEGHGGNNVADNLFFSKYYESAGNVKLWAIYNGTDHDISLTNVKVLISSNGGNWDITDGQKYKSLASYGRYKTGIIIPGEEIIVYNPGSSDKDTKILDCARDSGVITDTWYTNANVVSSFSGDDGLMLLNGTDTLDIIGGLNPSVAYTHVVNNGYNDANGWWCENGKTVEGDSVALSTNRCLLIRKNTVKSGLNAVSKNKDDFVTLCEEWVGKPIDGNDDVVASCKGFTYVSTFDYDEHYSSTSDLQELELDGSSKIEIENLSSHSCDELKITLYDGNNGSADITTHIPIMIYNDSTSSDIASNCDVIVMHGATLTIDNNLTSNDVTVYPGSRLYIPSEKIYTVNSLTLRRDNDSVPYFSYKGTLNVNDGIFFEMRTDGSDWRWLTLPDTLKSELINDKDEAIIRYYDDSIRAINGRGGWIDEYKTNNKVYTRKYAPGQGCLFGVDSDKKIIYSFELDPNILSRENNYKDVYVHAFKNPLAPPNDLGWNVVGNPFLDECYISANNNPIRLGELIHNDTDPWNGGWVISDTMENKLRYITVYNNETGEYESKLLITDGIKLKPYTSFFVQIDTTGSSHKVLKFSKTSGEGSSMMPARTKQMSEETFLQLNVNSKQTGCFVSNKYNDEYEINADLESFDAKLYLTINGYKLIYSAINDSIIEHGINVFGYGEVSLNDMTDINSFEEINIFYDEHWYNLLNSDTPNVQGNFILFAKRKQNNDISTNLNEIPIYNIRKFIYNGNVYIIKENEVYNILGEKIR